MGVLMVMLSLFLTPQIDGLGRLTHDVGRAAVGDLNLAASGIWTAVARFRCGPALTRLC